MLRFISLLQGRTPPHVVLLTNLAPGSMLQGSLDTKAVAKFCKEFPEITVRHLPGLHAKSYVADEHTAIVTSGNLTSSSLFQNYEYGIQVDDPAAVRRIASDLVAYGRLGTQVSIDELDRLAEISESLKAKYSEALNSAQKRFKDEFEQQLEVMVESLRLLRAKPGESTNSIFARTIVYILRDGPLATRDIHPLISMIHPDLCDDRIDRVINGVRFGRAWKHRVRGAQVNLRRQGLIELAGGNWHLPWQHADPSDWDGP